MVPRNCCLAMLGAFVFAVAAAVTAFVILIGRNKKQKVVLVAALGAVLVVLLALGLFRGLQQCPLPRGLGRSLSIAKRSTAPTSFRTSATRHGYMNSHMVSAPHRPVSARLPSQEEQSHADADDNEHMQSSDPEECLKRMDHLKNAASLGDLDACYDLAHIYNYGECGDINPGEAMRWYKTAADGGHAKSQLELGMILRWLRRGT
jgi:hypothetical protein